MSAADAVLTDRLVLRPWEPRDAAEALAVFGQAEVTRWLSPAIDPIEDEEAMRAAIAAWADAEAELDPPVGHWAVRRREDGVLVGAVALRRLPPELADLELAWQLAPEHQGHGYATEAARAVAGWAFAQSAHELFSVVRPRNERAVKLALRLGMEWVGETSKYYGLDLQVYRLRPPDLAAAALDGRAR
jgi:RimJ/RimL family protein N-acetyltransferase